MLITRHAVFLTPFLFVAAHIAAAEPVTMDNYVVAETDWNFAGQQAKADVNTFTHDEPVTMDNQSIIRSNRDVMYSRAVVDVSEGATLTVPPRDNFQIIHVIDENNLTNLVIKAGESVTIGPDDVTGGTHVYLLARTRLSEDLEESKAAQKAMTIEANSASPYKPKDFDEAEVVAFREKLVQEYVDGKAKIIEHKSFGRTMNDVDPTSYVYAAAVGWGGLPYDTAQYLPALAGQGDDSCQKYTYPKPDLDWEDGGFFSLTTYDSAGWIVEDNFYIGHEDMEEQDGNVIIYLNCRDNETSLTVQKGWTGVLRMYLPTDPDAMIKYVDEIRTITPEKM